MVHLECNLLVPSRPGAGTTGYAGTAVPNGEVKS